MNIRLIRNSIRKLVPFLLYLAYTLSLAGCTKKERYEKEKYDRDLKITHLQGSDYKECKAYTQTVLLPKKKIIGTTYAERYFKPEKIVKGDNLIAFYYYDNPGCGMIDGWSNQEVLFEFIDLQPKLEKSYSLPQKQIKIFYRSENSDMPTVYDHKDLAGKIIFHEFSEDKIKFSVFLDPLFYANNPERRGKYPVLNFSNLEFKAFTEKFYEGDDYEPLVKLR